MQTQTSNTLHNAIMKAGGKDRPPMLAPGNYVQWKSRIKRYIDTKPNHELIHYCLKNPPYKFTWADKVVLVSEGSPETTIKTYMENYKNVSQDIRDQLNAEAEAVQIILTGIDNDIYSTVDAWPNACEMWKAIERLKHGESINVQDLETNLYWEFRKFTSRDGESLKSYYSRFYKMMNELVRNQCDSQELKTVSYHKLYDIMKQHQSEVNKLRAERIARTANPLALVAQQQPVYHPQNHPTHYPRNSSTRSQQAATRNRGKAIVNSPIPIYDQEPSMVDEDDEMSKDKEIDKLMDLISLSFKKIYKPTNNNLRTSSNTSRANQDNSPRINRGDGYDNQRLGNVARARETVEQADWRDDTDDESKDQELEAHYMYMAQLQEVTPDVADNSEPIFDIEPLQKVPNNDNYNVFAIESKHSEQSKYVHDTYPIEQDEHNVIIDSLDMSYDREQIDQNDDDDDFANERELLASLIEKLKCEIDDSKNRNKFLETSNKVLVNKLKGEIEDFKNKNKFKEANNKLSETNALMYNNLKKFQAELDRRNDVEYASKDLKAQLQDKGIAISELKKLIEKLKGKSVDTKFEKSSIIRQPNAFKSQRPSILGKPTIFSYSLERKDFSKSKLVTKNIVSNDLSKPVTAQILPLNKKSILKNTNVLASRMYKLHTKPTQTRTSQLPNDFRKTNKRVSFSTGVIPTTSVSRPQLKSNRIEDRVLLNNSQGKKQDVEDHRRNVKFSKNKTSVTACNDSLKAKTSNVNFVSVTCGKCMLNEKHDICVLKSHNGVNSRTKMPIVVPVSTREPKRTVKQSVAKPLKKTVASESTNQKPRNTNRKLYENLVEIIIFIIDSGCSKHMTGNLKLLINFVEKFMGTVKFRNDQIAPILGYGDLGNDLLTGFCGTNLYSITLQDTTSPNPICLMAKATSSQAWLWHRRLSHLNFDTINLLSKNDIVIDKNPSCTLGDYSKPSHKGYRNTIELPVGNNMVPLRSDTIRLEEEGWNDPVILEEGSLDYKNPNIEQLLGAMECKVDMLMKNAISLMGRSEDVYEMTSDMMHQLPPEPSRQEAFKDLVIVKLKEEIKMEENRIKKIMRYPNTEDLEPLNGHKFSEALIKKESFHTPKFVSPKSLSVKYFRIIFPSPLLVREITFGFKPSTKNNRNVKSRYDAENLNPQSAPQVLPSFEEYTPSVTYPKEVEETLGTPIEVGPLDETQLEDLGLNTCNHDIPLSSREVLIFYEPEPQPQPLPNCLSLDVSLGDERVPEPPIKPHSPDSFRMKVVDNLTIHTPSSPYVVSFYLKDTYFYYHPCIDDPKKHYRFKPSLLVQSRSL
uniref:Ribonuclease H-like domain-containing protein n=1 Tax=Tanacetum cinerariifolium TaxID=118510 RepID=A0A6L2LB15_TANCI|nr:ribonuclease H-like domain-containing protein [Tanacetum cinerariifolium]